MLAGASNTPYWLDDPGRPAGRPALTRDTTTDLLVVGGGYTGLWTALLAKESEPDRDVVLVEAERIGWAASGRNGGFCSASLTHGAANGRERFPDEFDVLQSMGVDNLRGLRATVERFAIDCELEATGELDVATEDHQVEWLRDAADEDGAEFLDAEAVRRQVDSPTYRAGLWDRDGAVLVHPAKLAWGLARAAESLGVRIFEGTRARGIDTAGVPSGRRVLVGAGESTVTARQVVLGTNAFPSLVRRARPFVVPVYDYAIVTEPLTAAELGAIGWANRQGIGDSANQFHYYRLTADNRILFGGYDAVYHFGGRVKASYDTRRATFGLLADHLDATFPQLGGAAEPRVGRRDRPVRAVLRVLRYGAPRPGGIRGGLHRPGCRGQPVRRPGDAGLAFRYGDGAHRDRDGAQQATAVPARAAGLARRPGDACLDQGGRP